MPAATMWEMARPRATSRTFGEPQPVNNSTIGYSYSIKGGPAPSRPPREFIETQHETAPPVRPPPRNPRRNDNRNTVWPGPGSYLQPSATIVADFSAQRKQDMMETISPPSSPEPEYAPRRPADRSQRQQPDRDVSPLGEDGRVMPLARGVSQNAGRDMSGSQQTSNGAQARSSIPMMRRARRRQSDAALREEAQARERSGANNRGNQPGAVRYDAMAGEMTASTAARHPVVKPAEYAHGLGITTGSPPSTQNRSASGVMTSFGNRVRQMAHTGRVGRKSEATENETDPAAKAFSSSRPGWRGASGRTALVEPVHDNLEVPPLNIPPKSSKRSITPTFAESPTAIMSTLGRSDRGNTPPVSPPGAETHSESTPRKPVRKVVPHLSQVEAKQAIGGPSYPSPPLSDTAEGSDAPSIAAKQLLSSMPSNYASTAYHSQQHHQPEVHRKPPSAHANHANHAHQESLSSIYSQVSEPAAHNAQGAGPNTLPPSDPWVQPSSRFSITTYATSAAATPRASFDDFDHDHPPVPETPLQYRELPQSKPSSIMERRRPVPTGSESMPSSHTIHNSIHPALRTQDQYMSSPFSAPPPSSAALQRKAAATGAPFPTTTSLLRSNTTASRTESIASDMNKSLPTPPPEVSARDRVTMINAQLQSLGNRRININRSIKQMTELMPTDSILNGAAVVQKRELEKKKVEALKLELAEVQREEYELGLKLHRAYKRMDRDADYEPTTLWVRRVTG